MKFQKLLRNLGSQIKLAGLSLLLPLGFITGSSTAAVISPPTLTQPIENSSPGIHQDFLIAKSTQLRNLFDASSFSNSSQTVMRLNGTHTNWQAAYDNAWDWFGYITVDNSIRYITRTPSAGAIYRGDLIGGGYANLREKGSSGLYPTIDTREHYSDFPYGRVIEVKFIY